jgi:hypothetical protein
VEKCWKLQAKKASMEVNNEDEYHEDQDGGLSLEIDVLSFKHKHNYLKQKIQKQLCQIRE